MPETTAQEAYKILMAEHVVPFLRVKGFKGSARSMTYSEGDWQIVVEHRKSRWSKRDNVIVLRDFSVRHRPSDELDRKIREVLTRQADRQLGVMAITGHEPIRPQNPRLGMVPQFTVGNESSIESTAAGMIANLEDQVLPYLLERIHDPRTLTGVVVFRHDPQGPRTSDENARLLRGIAEGGVGNLNRTAPAVFAAMSHPDPLVRQYVFRLLQPSPLEEISFSNVLFRLGGPTDPPASVPDMTALHHRIRAVALDDPDPIVRRDADRALQGLGGILDESGQLQVWSAPLPGVVSFDGSTPEDPVGVTHAATRELAATRLGVPSEVPRPSGGSADLYCALHGFGLTFWSDQARTPRVWHVLD